VTVTLPLEPQEEARLAAVVQAKGLSAEELVRAALDRIPADASELPDARPAGTASGAALIAAMQASPYRDLEIEPTHSPRRRKSS